MSAMVPCQPSRERAVAPTTIGLHRRSLRFAVPAQPRAERGDPFVQSRRGFAEPRVGQRGAFEQLAGSADLGLNVGQGSLGIGPRHRLRAVSRSRRALRRSSSASCRAMRARCSASAARASAASVVCCASLIDTSVCSNSAWARPRRDRASSTSAVGQAQARGDGECLRASRAGRCAGDRWAEQ